MNSLKSQNDHLNEPNVSSEKIGIRSIPKQKTLKCVKIKEIKFILIFIITTNFLDSASKIFLKNLLKNAKG